MVEFRERGPQLTRGSRALKLWLSLDVSASTPSAPRSRRHRARRARRATLDERRGWEVVSPARLGDRLLPPRGRRRRADRRDGARGDRRRLRRAEHDDPRRPHRRAPVHDQPAHHRSATSRARSSAWSGSRADGSREGRRTAGPPCSRCRSCSRGLDWSGPSGRSAGVALRGVREGCRPLGHAHRKQARAVAQGLSTGHATMQPVSLATSHEPASVRSWRVDARDVGVTALTGTLASDHAHQFINPIR